MRDLLAVIESSPVLRAAREAYPEFADLPQGETIAECNGFDVAELELGGESYVVRRYHTPNNVRADLMARLPALKNATRPGLERLAAFSIEAGALVTHRMFGRSIEAISPEGAAHMTLAQFREMTSLVDWSVERKIEIDYCAGNIFYDSDKGFGFVDIARPITEPSTLRTLKGIMQAFMWVGHDLDTFDSQESLDARTRAIKTLTSAVFRGLTSEVGIELSKSSAEYIALCRTGEIYTMTEIE
ncbi:MAG: hypothetical protein WAS36_00155 [Candidatus Saccharimonadales bacterium]